MCEAVYLFIFIFVQLEENEMNWNLSNLKYKEGLIKGEVKLKVGKLNELQLCLDKLCFANTAYKSKNSSCFSAGELDKQVINT